MKKIRLLRLCPVCGQRPIRRRLEKDSPDDYDCVVSGATKGCLCERQAGYGWTMEQAEKNWNRINPGRQVIGRLRS